MFRSCLLFLSLLISGTIFGQWKNTSPLSATLIDITFTDAYTGFACGQGGAIGNCQLTYNFYKTIDGGNNWIKLRTGTTNQPKALHFVDNLTGWIACSSSEVLKTQDGGMTWTQQTQGVGSGYNDIWFVSPSTGFVIGNNGLLRRSTNGGNSWQTITSGTSSTLRRIHFSSTNYGFISVSGGDILRTTNGGNSWSTTDLGANSINDFSFVDELSGFAAGYMNGAGVLFSTTDGGASWESQELGEGVPTRVFFVDAQHGFVVVDGVGILRTQDGGMSWETSTTFNQPWDSWQGIHFENPQVGYLSGSNGQILKSTDGGASWKSQQTAFGSQVNTVETTHRDTAFFGDINGKVYQTVNAGVNIRQLLPEREEGAIKCIAPSPSSVVMAFYREVLHSSDGGESWNLAYEDENLSVSDMHFPTEEVGYISTLDTLLLKTVNGGTSWTALSLPFEEYYRTLWFTSADTGYVASDEFVYKTTDGGNNWTSFWLDGFPLNIVGTIRDMVFSSDSIGYISNSSDIYWTRDAGNTWEERTETNGNTINEMWFANDSLAYFTRNSSQGISIDSCAILSSSSTACLANNWSMHGIDMTDGGDFGYSVGGLSGILHTKEQPELLRPFLSTESYCSGSQLFVGFIGKGLIFGSTFYEVELSDAFGNFSNPTVIGSVDMDGSLPYQSNIVTCQLPVGLPSGSGYRVRVNNAGSGILSPDNGYDITIGSVIEPNIEVVGTTISGICPGDPAEATAQFSGGGLSPELIWSVNGIPIQEGGNAIFLEDWVDGDQLTLTLTSSLACASPATVTSNILELSTSDPIISNIPDTLTVCSGTPLQLEANPEYTYNWSPTASLSATDIFNPVFSADSSQLLTTQITDENACSLADSVFVVVNPLPEILTEDTTLCEGQSLLLQATPGGSYTWSPESVLNDATIANPVATPETTTTISVDITSIEGCSASDAVLVQIDAPVELLTPDSTVCADAAFTLTAEDAISYLWQPSTAFTDNTQQNPIASISEPTDFTLQAISALGCLSTDSVTIVPESPVEILLSDTSICTGSSLALLAGEAENYLWSPEVLFDDPEVFNPIITVEEDVVVHLEAESALGCTSFDSLAVTAYSIATVTFTHPDGVCPGQCSTLSAEFPENATSFSWSPATGLDDPFSPAPIACIEEDSEYDVTFSDENGCENVGTTFLELLPLPVTPSISFEEGILTSSEASTYQWLLDGQPIDGATDQNYTPEVEGAYSVVVSNGEGCEAVSADLDVILISVNESLLPLNWAVHQVNSGLLKVHLPSINGNSLVAVRESSGKLLFQKDLAGLSQAGRTLLIPCDQWSSGVYLITLYTEGLGIETRRIILQK